MSAMTKKEWVAFLQKAVDEFDWEAARESHSNTPVIDESAAKRIATALGWGPKRDWVGLTDEQYLEACQMAEGGNYMVAFQRIQQWLKENNA